MLNGIEDIGLRRYQTLITLERRATRLAYAQLS
jgi:hypothetical protein